MSATWDEQTRAAYRDATGATDAEIDRIEGGALEHRAMQEQAIENRLTWERSQRAAIANELAQRERLDALSSATEIYESGEADPAAIATALEQTAGRDVALEWASTTWAPDEAVPLTAAEWTAQREREAAATIEASERLAGVLRDGAIEREQRERTAYFDGIESDFLEAHPDAEAIAPLVWSNFDNKAAQADPRAALEAAYATAKREHVLGERASVEAAEAKPFRDRSIASGLAKPGGVQFVGIEDAQSKAERLFAERQAIPVARTAEEETAHYAQEWASRAAANFDGALVRTGGSTKAERDAHTLLNRGQNKRNVIDQFENRPARQREAMDQAVPVPAAAEVHPDATPSSAWWYQ